MERLFNCSRCGDSTQGDDSHYFCSDCERRVHIDDVTYTLAGDVLGGYPVVPSGYVPPHGFKSGHIVVQATPDEGDAVLLTFEPDDVDDYRRGHTIDNHAFYRFVCERVLPVMNHLHLELRGPWVIWTKSPEGEWIDTTGPFAIGSEPQYLRSKALRIAEERYNGASIVLLEGDVPCNNATPDVPAREDRFGYVPKWYVWSRAETGTWHRQNDFASRGAALDYAQRESDCGIFEGFPVVVMREGEEPSPLEIPEFNATPEDIERDLNRERGGEGPKGVLISLLDAIDANIEDGVTAGMPDTAPVIPLQYIAEELEAARHLLVPPPPPLHPKLYEVRGECSAQFRVEVHADSEEEARENAAELWLEHVQRASDKLEGAEADTAVQLLAGMTITGSRVHQIRKGN